MIADDVRISQFRSDPKQGDNIERLKIAVKTLRELTPWFRRVRYNRETWDKICLVIEEEITLRIQEKHEKSSKSSD